MACLTFFLFVKKTFLNSNPDVSVTHADVKRSGILFARLKSAWWKLRTPFSLKKCKREYERGSTEKENKKSLAILVSSEVYNLPTSNTGGTNLFITTSQKQHAYRRLNVLHDGGIAMVKYRLALHLLDMCTILIVHIVTLHIATLCVTLVRGYSCEWLQM